MHMHQRGMQKVAAALLTVALVIGMPGAGGEVYAASKVLKQGSKSSEVVKLQKRLKELKLFKATSTGYYGKATRKAVVEFQKQHGLKADGIAGKKTLGLLYAGKAASRTYTAKSGTVKTASRGGDRSPATTAPKAAAPETATSETATSETATTETATSETAIAAASPAAAGETAQPPPADAVETDAGEPDAAIAVGETVTPFPGEIIDTPLIPWFGGVNKLFVLKSEAVVTDVETGIGFRIMRTGGVNHADVETVSKEDTSLLDKIYGEGNRWARRAVVVEVNGRQIAGSMTGMPHAGREDMPARVMVSGRSDGYGRGINYDSIKGNGMSGHIDIHFLNSRTHGTNRVDERHQAMVKAAAEYMERTAEAKATAATEAAVQVTAPAETLAP